ncbi:hypothetical protein Ancab_032632 [Ancistrocladus abbreviatus]
MWDIAILLLVSLIVIWVGHWVHIWRNPKSNGKLPPGSMGLPLIGETIQFLYPNSLYGAPPFIAKRVARYGSLFRSSLLGQKVIISADPEVNHYIFQQEGKLFQCSYTKSSEKIFGSRNLMTYQGISHKYLRNLTLNLVSVENLKKNMVNEMDKITQEHLHAWTRLDSVEVKDATAEV